MRQWFRDWQRARLERKVFEALFELRLMDYAKECSFCDDDPEQCICGQLDGCEKDCD
jgi:hypothetical protein